MCVCVFISTLHFTLCLHCAPFSSHVNSLKIEMNLLCTSHSISHLYEWLNFIGIAQSQVVTLLLVSSCAHVLYVTRVLSMFCFQPLSFLWGMWITSQSSKVLSVVLKSSVAAVVSESDALIHVTSAHCCGVYLKKKTQKHLRKMQQRSRAIGYRPVQSNLINTDEWCSLRYSTDVVWAFVLPKLCQLDMAALSCRLCTLDRLPLRET